VTAVEEGEDMTLFLVTHSHQYDGYNGLQWSDEDVETAAWRGYFFTREDAEAWIDDEKQKRIADGRAKNDADLERANAAAKANHEAKAEQEAIQRTEYDALEAAGISPSFDRPKDRGPFKPRVSKFNEEVYLRGLGERWEVVEMEPCEWKKEDEET
jgi:hypothetical protein